MYSGCVTIHWHAVNLTEATLLKKTDSASPNSYQLSVALQLVMEFGAYIPPLSLRCCLAWPYAVLVHAVTITMSSYV